MANLKSSQRDIISSEKHRQHNVAQKNKLRTQLKKVVEAIQKKDLAVAQTTYIEAVSLLDHFAVQGLIHKNKAARHKSRLNAHIKKLTSEKS